MDESIVNCISFHENSDLGGWVRTMREKWANIKVRKNTVIKAFVLSLTSMRRQQGGEVGRELKTKLWKVLSKVANPWKPSNVSCLLFASYFHAWNFSRKTTLSHFFPLFSLTTFPLTKLLQVHLHLVQTQLQSIPGESVAKLNHPFYSSQVILYSNSLNWSFEFPSTLNLLA